MAARAVEHLVRDGASVAVMADLVQRHTCSAGPLQLAVSLDSSVRWGLSWLGFGACLFAVLARGWPLMPGEYAFYL